MVTQFQCTFIFLDIQWNHKMRWESHCVEDTKTTLFLWTLLKLSRDYLIWQWPKKLIRFSFHHEAQQCHGKNKFKLERTSKLRPRSTTQLLQTFCMACQCKKTNKTKSPRVWKGIDKYKRYSLSNLKGSFDSESVICIPIAQSSGSNRQKVELLETLLCQTPIWQVKRRKKNRDVRN